MSEQCGAIKKGGGYRSSQCSRRGVVMEEGVLWCRQHAPSAVAARAQKIRAWRQDRIAARDKRWAEATKRAERQQACTAAFHDPAGRTIATEDIAEGVFWNVYRFVEWVAWQPCTCPDDDPCMSCQACDAINSLKVQGPET